MPNHVSHKISFSKECTNLQEALEAVRTVATNENEETNYFDFNKLIPEPEELAIIRYPHDLVSLVYYLTNRGTEKLSRVDLWRFNPSDITTDYDTALNSMREVMMQYDSFGRIKENPDQKYSHFFRLPDTLDELYQSGKAVISLRNNHKCKNWYDTHCKYWGTKWNSYSTFYDGEYLTFDTAWASPQPVIAEFARKFNLTMTVKAFDEGHNFWFIHNYENGELTEEYNDEEDDKNQLIFEIYGYDPEEEDEDEDEDEKEITVS